MQFYKLTHTQKAFAVVGLAAAACVSIFMVMSAQPRVVNSTHLSTVNSMPVAQEPRANAVLLATAEVVSAQSQYVENPVASQAIPRVAASASWQMASVKAAVPKIALSERIADYAIVEIEQHPAHFPAAGERIQLPMLNGKQVIVNVESSTANPNGDYTWSGHLDGFGSDYPAVMTYGEHSIFATITTPEGSYTMESLDGSGWLYKNPAEVELSAPGAKDFLEIGSVY